MDPFIAGKQNQFMTALGKRGLTEKIQGYLRQPRARSAAGLSKRLDQEPESYQNQDREPGILYEVKHSKAKVLDPEKSIRISSK